MQQMCQKLRQVRQKVGNWKCREGDRVPNPDRRAEAIGLRRWSRYGLPYLFVGPMMSKGKKNMRTTSVNVVRIATKGPGDVSGLRSLIEQGEIDPKSIVAILGKTEGNGGVNDFTREFAVSALSAVLAPYVDLPPHRVEQRIAFVMSGGTEGVLSPHITVFTRDGAGKRGSEGISGKRLSIGMAHTRDFLPEEIGRGVQIRETARAVAAAMAEAAIFDPQDVHFVQIKCPLLTSDRVEAAAARGNKTVTTSAYGSMGYSRGASALGVALALGEIEGEIDDEHVLRRFDLFSSVASTSAGIELMHNVVIVLAIRRRRPPRSRSDTP